jgi:NADH-quinone oxidoreductase subunit N
MGSIVVALILVTGAYGGMTPAFGGMYSADAFSGYMKVLVMLGTFAALAMSLRTEGDSDINKPEYSLLILLALVGMMLMISADNLMSLYMAIELQSLPLYVVAAMRLTGLVLMACRRWLCGCQHLLHGCSPASCSIMPLPC